MAKSIEALKGAFSSTGYQKASHFSVGITAPVQSPLGGNTEYYVSNVTLPGRNMMTSDIKYGLNLSEKKVYSSAYSPCTVTFMCDGGMDLFRWFADWQDMMQDPYTGRVEYSNNYVGTVEIYTYDTVAGITHTHKLEAAFPENLGDINLSHGEEGIATFDVTFVYRHYSNSPGTFSPGGSSLGGGLVTAAFGGIPISASLGPLSINGNLGRGGFTGGFGLSFA